MLQYGRQHCNSLGAAGRTADQNLADTYYDAQWVYYQIYDYTHDSFWLNCAEKAESIYRDQYSVPAGGQVPGYWNFSHGLAQSWLRTGDSASKSAEISLSKNAAFCPDSTPLAWSAPHDTSREVAYCIMSYLNAEDLGQPRRARLTDLVNQAYGHLDQWFVSNNASFMRPFMVSLTSHALISYYERTGDSRLLPALTDALDKMWDRTWLPASGAFKYTDRVHETGGMEPAPDLNLLIAPIYAWVYHETGIVRFRDRADQIFSGGVNAAFLNNGKQFNQNYRLSFEYVRLRKLAPLR